LIRIFPVHHFSGRWPFEPTPVPADFLWGDRPHRFFQSGTAAIRHVCRHLGLKREEEVCILTSSDSTYVTTCVSATIFNYCGISRVVSERTRLLYVIHEFGVPHPKIRDIAALGRKKGIPVVEDCAHTADSTTEGQRVGTFADYAIYSLPKLWPVHNGGVLVGPVAGLSDESPVPIGNEQPTPRQSAVQRSVADCLPFLPALSNRRKENYHAIRGAFPSVPVVFECDDQWTPYFLIFRTTSAAKIYATLSAVDIEWGVTHVDGWFAVPTQPLMGADNLETLIDVVGQAFAAHGVISGFAPINAPARL
jgi:hypothetical protein